MYMVYLRVERGRYGMYEWMDGCNYGGVSPDVQLSVEIRERMLK